MGPNILGSRSWPFQVTWRHRSRDQLIRHMPFPIGSYQNRVSIYDRFQDNGPQTYWDHDLDLSRSLDVIQHTHTSTRTRAASDFMVCPMQCNALDRQQHADKNDKNDDIVQCGARSGASCWYWEDCRQIFYARRQLPHCTKLIIHALFLRLSADFGASPLDYFFKSAPIPNSSDATGYYIIAGSKALIIAHNTRPKEYNKAVSYSSN